MSKEKKQLFSHREKLKLMKWVLKTLELEQVFYIVIFLKEEEKKHCKVSEKGKLIV